MITTYAELQTAVGDFLNRQDLAASIPTFIALAEADINRVLRHWRMETRADLTAAGRYTDLPADWLETKRIRTTGDSGRELKLLSDAQMDRVRSTVGGQPYYYAFSGGQLELQPAPDDTYTIEHTYYAKIPALTDAAPTNWALTDHPDLFLYGALGHSAPYLVEDSRLPVWGGLYASAMTSAQNASKAAQYSGNRVMRVI